MNKKTSSPNDQRSVVKNPNNPQFNEANGNRGKQLNPNQTQLAQPKTKK